MAEYDIAFAKRLADIAADIVLDGMKTEDAKRTVLYLSLLSCEISLKSMLEKAGKSVKDISHRKHNLKSLLEDIDQCEIEVELTPGNLTWRPATKLRAVSVDDRFANATIGNLFQAEAEGASAYPNEIRYGNMLTHYPAEVVSRLAFTVHEWANKHWNTIRVCNN